MSNQLDISTVMVTIKPIGKTKWRVEGPRGTFWLTLADSGGWNIESDSRLSVDHYSMLHHALTIAYRLAIGDA